jgi:hypothetical protein
MRKFNWYTCFKVLLLVFSGYLLWAIFGIYINGQVNLKYDAISMSDVEHCVKYAKIVLVYIVLMIIFLILTLKMGDHRNKKK